MESPLLSIQKNGEIGIMAPTGYGKSTGIFRIVSESEKDFGNTLFVFPTRVAKNQVCMQSFCHIFPCTPKLALKLLLEWKTHFETIIIDEAHCMIKEYHTIFKILNILKTIEKKEIKIICLSATLDQNYLLQFFPLMSFLDLPPKETAFPIRIDYEPEMQCNQIYPNFYKISFAIEEKLIFVTERKILVFLATHDQCEKMKRNLAKRLDNYMLLTMHGGMDDEDIEKTKVIMNDKSKKYICFATNMIESAVTFIDVDLVIDSGICCKLRENTLKIEYCDKVSMIQRSGRTGRTCPGKVIRLMKEEFFNQLPIQTYPRHDFDSIVLQMLNLQKNPEYYLGQESYASMRKFEHLNISGNKKLLRFLEECGLGIKSGLEYYRLQTNKKAYTTIAQLGLLICISIHHFYEMKKGGFNIIYNDGNFNKIQKKIAKHFYIPNDPLLSILNILITVFIFSKDPKTVAAEYSFNFKTLRGIWSVFKTLFYRSFPHCNMSFVYNLFCKYDLSFEEIRKFYFYSPYTQIYMVNQVFYEYENPTYFRDFISLGCNYDAHNCMIGLTNNEYSSITEYYNTVLLWISPPKMYKDHKYYLHELKDFVKSRREKEKNKKEFEKTLDEIRKDVAYRPGFYKIIEDVQDLVDALSRGIF